MASGDARGNIEPVTVRCEHRSTQRGRGTVTSQRRSGRTVVFSPHRADIGPKACVIHRVGARTGTTRVTARGLRAAASGRTNRAAMLQEVDEHVVTEGLGRGEKGPSPVEFRHLLHESL